MPSNLTRPALILTIIATALLAAVTLNNNSPNLIAAGLEPNLQARVTQLIADVNATPTNEKNLTQRARILWQWANAYALNGHPIHPDLPQTMTRLLSGAPLSKRALTGYQLRINNWTREFAFVQANPTAIGQLTSQNLGPFTVDSYTTITQTYTVGSAPITTGGGFLFTTRAYAGRTAIQTDQPKAPNYLTIKSSNKNVAFEATQLQVTGMFSGALGGSFPKPYFKLIKGQLNPGDTVTLTLGDTSAGSPGTITGTTSSSALRYRIWVKLDAESSRFPLHELPFTTKGGPTTAVRGFAPSILKTSETFDLSIRSEDAYRNRATTNFTPYQLTLNGKPYKTITNTTAAINTLHNLRFDQPGVYQINIQSNDGKIIGKTNPILVEDNPTQRIYWGETHGHSGFAEGSGTVDGFYNFARDDAKLDFTTLSEHDLWMDDSEWETLRNATIRHRRPGEFETFVGYEWTVNTKIGGHHNVLFRTPEGRRRVENQRAPILPILFEKLHEENRDEDVLIIPHAHNPGHYWEVDPKLETMLEIVSNHGTFEWLGKAYLSRGNHIGFVGGSDDHIGHPGLRPLRKTSSSDNQGGLAAAVAPSKSRDQIFDALKNRSAYATNGQRIILRTTLNGHEMGTTITSPATTPTIKARTVGTNPIESITVVKNGRDVFTQDFTIPKDPTKTHFVELRFFSEGDPRALYEKSRDARRWTGSVTVTGAKVLAVTTPNVENIYSEGAKISEGDPQSVGFIMRTRGSSRSIILQLDSPATNATFQVQSQTGPARTGTKINHTFKLTKQNATQTFNTPIDNHPDTLTLRPYQTPTKIDRQFTWVDNSNSPTTYPQFPTPDGTPKSKTPNTSYYLRIIQTDGGMAWSTPMWVK